MKKLLLTFTAVSAFITNIAMAEPLTVLWFSDNNEGKVLQKLADKYAAEENPEFKMNLLEVAYKELPNRLGTMITGKTPPAIVRQPQPLTYADVAVNLSDYINPEDYASSLMPYYVTDDKVIAVPMDVTANGMIYNKTLFDQAGVTPPLTVDNIWSWDDFHTNIQKVIDNSNAKYGLVWDFTPHRFSTLMYQYNGHFFDDNGSLSFNSPEVIKAIDVFKKLHDDGIMPKSVWVGTENPNSMFRSGTVAVHMSGSWMLSNYNEVESFEWGVMYMPKGDRRSSVPGGKFLQAIEGSGQEEEAAKFIAWLSKPENNKIYVTETENISPLLVNENIERPKNAENFQIFANELANTNEYAAKDWKNVNLDKFAKQFRDEIVDVLVNKKTPEAALNTAEKYAKRKIR